MAKQLANYREQLESRLESFSPYQRMAFAALCAERQYGTYVFVSRQNNSLDPQLVRHGIDLCWAAAAGNDLSKTELLQVKEGIDELIPDLTVDMSEHASLVLDATATVSYAINVCLSGSVDDAIFASQCARNSVDEWVQTQVAPAKDNLNDTIISISPQEVEQLQASVDAHPFMMREVQIQADALEYLSNYAQINEVNCKYLRGLCGIKSNVGLG
jgi:uncharacterized protein YjaG (DUF416 family)